MNKLIDILNDIKPGVDFEKETALIDNEIISSFDIITIVARINEEFDIDFPVNEIIPENFNSAKALYEVICKIENE
jgi:acyl carrier protein